MKRFWNKVSKGRGCWEWHGAKNSNGYGNIRVSGNTVTAHRLAWYFSHGVIPAGVQVLHKCDNKGCVRPSHLFLGTQLDNIADMVRKGRSKTCGNALKNIRGENNWHAQLTEKQIRQIRIAYAAGMRQQRLADKYHTTQSNISLIVRSISWVHVQ